MNRVSKFLIGLVLVGALGIASIHLGALPGNRADGVAKLAAIGSALETPAWANISVHGQKLILSGQAPSSEAYENLKAEIGEGDLIGGPFALIDYSGASAPTLPPVIDPHLWVAEKQDNTLILSGHVPSQNARDSVYQIASRHFRNVEISGDLEIAQSSVDEDMWASAVSVALPALARMENGAAAIDNNKVTLTGDVRDEVRAGTIRDLLSSAPAVFSVDTNLSVTQPAPSDLGEVIAAIDEDTIADMVDSTVPTQADEPNDNANEPNPIDAVDNNAGSSPEPLVQAPNPKPVPVVPSCEEQTRAGITRAQITFNTSETDINAASRASLDRIAEALKNCPDLKVTIVGHTDSRGTAARNQELSAYRADSVAAYLRALGIAQGRLSTRGAGETNPIASNINEVGRAQNRRIEFQFQ